MSDFPPVSEQLELLQRGSVDLVDLDQLRVKLERSRATGEPLSVMYLIWRTVPPKPSDSFTPNGIL